MRWFSGGEGSSRGHITHIEGLCSAAGQRGPYLSPMMGPWQPWSAPLTTLCLETQRGREGRRGKRGSTSTMGVQ